MDCDFQPPLQYAKTSKKANFDFTSDACGNYFDMREICYLDMITLEIK